MKNHSCILCTFILVLSLAACGADFDGSRTGNNNEFMMNYKVFNKTDSQDLIVATGCIDFPEKKWVDTLLKKLASKPFIMNLKRTGAPHCKHIYPLVLQDIGKKTELSNY